jgi:hypothetical protein
MIRVVVAASLGVALLAGCAGDDDGAPSATTASPATPTGPPVTQTPLPATEITIGDAVEFPEDIALVVETGCWQCDGPATALVRVYRRPDGSIAQDVLFGVAQLNLPDDGDEQEPRIQAFAVKPDASEMAIAVCTTKECGWLGPAEAGAIAKLYRSTDGGVTWAESGDWPLDHWMIGLAADGVLAGHQTNIPEKPDDPGVTWPAQPEWEFKVLPENRLIEPPAAAAAGEWPVVTDFGDVWWQAGGGRFIDTQGQPVLELPPGSRLGGVHGDPKGGFVADWWSDVYTPNGRHYLSLYDGGVPLATAEPVTFDAALIQAGGYFDAKSGTLYASIDVPFSGLPAPTPLIGGLVPALIDLVRGVAQPVPSPFIDGTSILPNPRNRIVAVQRGPFARVTGTGSCLNLRAEPSADAGVLDCLADGVLLLDVGPASGLVLSPTPVPPWVEVFTPAGEHGFVSGDFLER